MLSHLIFPRVCYRYRCQSAVVERGVYCWEMKLLSPEDGISHSVTHHMAAEALSHGGFYGWWALQSLWGHCLPAAVYICLEVFGKITILFNQKQAHIVVNFNLEGMYFYCSVQYLQKRLTCSECLIYVSKSLLQCFIIFLHKAAASLWQFSER